jgi:hypothetical protein
MDESNDADSCKFAGLLVRRTLYLTITLTVSRDRDAFFQISNCILNNLHTVTLSTPIRYCFFSCPGIQTNHRDYGGGVSASETASHATPAPQNAIKAAGRRSLPSA